jgi:hypothetical protein
MARRRFWRVGGGRPNLNVPKRVSYDAPEWDRVYKTNHKSNPERARLLHAGAPLFITCTHHLDVQQKILRGDFDGLQLLNINCVDDDDGDD